MKPSYESLLAQGEMFRTIADSAYDWEYWHGPNREIIYMTPSCERITGYAADEFVTDPELLYRVVHPEDRHLVDDIMHDFTLDKDATADFRIVRRDGEICWIGHACHVIFRKDGQFMGRRACNRDISERKRLEAELVQHRGHLEELVSIRTSELAESEKRLCAVLAEHVLIRTNAPIGILTVIPDEAGSQVIIRRANQAMEQLFGYDPAELDGLDTRNLYPSEDEYKSVSTACAKVMPTGGTYTGEHVYRRKNGQRFSGILRGSAIDPGAPDKGAIWLIEDISDVKHMQSELERHRKHLETQVFMRTAELRDSNQRLGSVLAEHVLVLRNASLGIITVVPRDDDCRVLRRTNRALHYMLGYGPGELEGQDARILYPNDEEFNAVTAVYVDVVCDGKAYTGEHIFRCKDGRLINVKLHGSAVDPADPRRGAIWLVDDITERKRLEVELLLAKEQAEQSAQQVTSLLDNSGQGFLSFGSDLVVDLECSRACIDMLGLLPSGQNAAEVLSPSDTAKADLLRLTIPEALTETDTYRRDLMLSLLPAEFQCSNKHLKAEYKLLENGHLMLVLTDISDEKLLEERIKNEHRRLEMIVAAVTDSRDFFGTVETFRTFASVELPAMILSPVAPGLILKEVYRQVHTFKGLMNQFSFRQTPQLLHQIESRLSGLRQLGNALSLQDISDIVLSAPYTELLDTDLKVLCEVLGDDFLENHDRIALTTAQVKQLEELASRLLHGDPIDTSVAEIRQLLLEIGYLRKVTIKDAMKGYDYLVKQIAERLEKQIAPLIVLGGEDVWIDPEQYRPFLNSLGHIFRNAVVHGIEEPDIRLCAEKHEAGTITCTVSRDDSAIKLSIADDGVGIDIKALRQKAVEMRLYKPDEVAVVPEDQILNLIFLDNFSTQSEATTFAGRGVGLAAMRKETEALGGNVVVRTNPGKGTEFLFTLATGRSSCHES